LGTSQEAFVTLSTIDPKSPSLGLLLKVQDSSKTEAGAILVEYGAGASKLRLSAIRLDAKSWTLYLNQAASVANGDALGARAQQRHNRSALVTRARSQPRSHRDP
jgi:hypothetical protein